MLDLLDATQQAEYAIKVPFYRWFGLKELIRTRRRWQRIDDTVSCFDKQLRVSAWQALSVLAFNITRGFQVATTARRRSPSRKRRALYRFQSIHTIRYQCLHRAGLLIRPNGRSILDVGTAPAVRRRFSRIHRQLQNVA